MSDSTLRSLPRRRSRSVRLLRPIRALAWGAALVALSWVIQSGPMDSWLGSERCDDGLPSLDLGMPHAEAQRRRGPKAQKKTKKTTTKKKTKTKKSRRGKKDRKAARANEQKKLIKRHMFTAQYYLLHENDPAAAADEYRAVLELDAKHFDAGLGLVHIHIKKKESADARALLEKLAESHPKQSKVWHALGQVASEAGDSDGALKAYRQALAINRADAEAHWLVFQNLHSRFRKGDRAVKRDLSRAISGYLLHADKRHGIRHKIVARANVEVSDDPMALTVYDADVAYKSAFSDARMGQINRMMAKARAGYQECVRSQPKNQRCHLGLGLVHASVKASDHYDRDKARRHFLKASKLPEAHIELARMARFEDDLASARRALSKALVLSKDHQRALIELGIVYKLEGRSGEAASAFVKAFKADARSADGNRAMEELVKLEPEHPLIKERSQWSLPPGDIFTSDRFEAAILRLEEALGGVQRNAPEQAALETMLGRLLDAADVDSSTRIRVGVLKTEMPNALALPNGNIYFTRGMLDYIKKAWPKRRIDADHDVVAHILAHEVAHVIRRHTLQTNLYQEAQKSASGFADASVLTHVTRLHEIEADRVGIVMAFLAGYHPRGGIEVMEARGKIDEIPKNLDHPTFDERVHYLEEYWSNDVKHGFVSFGLGVADHREGDRLLARDANKAAASYKKSLENFRRFRDTLKPTKAVLNNMAVVHAKLGLMSLAKKGSPLHRWQSELSVEQQSAVKYVAVTRRKSRSRGSARAAIPKDLVRAEALLKDALKRDASYARARANLAAVYIAMGDTARAGALLGKVGASKGGKASRARRSARVSRVAMMRGILLAETGKYNKAIEEFRVATQDPALRNAGTYNLARLYVLAGDKKKARQLYERYLRVVPRGPWADAAKREMKSL